MTPRCVLAAVLVVSFSVPAMAYKPYYVSREPNDQCKIVNIAPYYTRTTIRRGKRVYVTREVAQRDMAIVCKTPNGWR
jgi:hypothetical protein